MEVINNSPIICHHGTKGMKWGRRLYQNQDGSLTALGKVRYKTNGEFRTKIKRQEAAKKAREARSAKKQYEEDKQKALKSGSAKDLLKYKGDLTQQEMDTAFRRIQWEQNMKSISDREVATGKTKAQKFFDKVDKATGYAQTGFKAYNTIANLVNAFNTNKLLPKIEVDNQKGNRDQVKKDRKEKQKEKEAAAKRAKQEAEGDAKRAERAKKKAEKEKVSGTVEGEGTSKAKTNTKSNKKPDDYYDPIDGYGEWVNDTPVSSVPAVYKSSGRSSVRRYIEDNGMFLLEDLSR